MEGNIYPRVTLWPGEQRDLERTQFNELNTQQQASFEQAYQILQEVKASENDSFSIEDLTLPDIKALIDENRTRRTGDKYPPLPISTVDLYMEALCNYINKIRCTADTSSVPPQQEASGYTTRPRKVRQTERFLSCRFISNEDFELIRDASPEETTELLKELDLDGEAFKNLDYLFIAFHAPNIGETGHFFLLGIAPKQKFVFAIDSLYYQNHSINTPPVVTLMKILRSQVGANAITAWPLYGQWSVRAKDTKDRSPDAPMQRDLYNCGLFTLTYAYCLGFGFDLLCFEEEDIDPLKRPRAFIDLATAINKQFRADCAYDMLDIPNGPLYLNENVQNLSGRSPSPDVGLDPSDDPDQNDQEDEGMEDDDAGSEEMEDEDGEDEDAEDDGMEEDDSEEEDAEQGNDDAQDQSDSDLDEQHGMIEEQSDPINGESSSIFNGNNSNLRQDIQAAIFDDLIRRLPDTFKAWKAGVQYTRQSEMERRDFPPQFDRRYFKKAGFLYPTNADRIIYLDEVEGETDQNVISACVAEFFGEDVKPFDGLTDGFAAWKEKYLNLDFLILERKVKRWNATEMLKPGSQRDVILLRNSFTQEMVRGLRRGSMTLL